MKIMNVSILMGLTLFAFSAQADFGKCNLFFPKGKAPSVSSSKMINVKKTRELCFSDFAILYSVDSKTPVYCVQKLSYLTIGKKEARTNHFHEEPMLRKEDRSTLEDYKGSKLDRGHNCPAADQKSELSMEESFSMSNITPQAQNLNRKSWAKNVEMATRKYVQRSSGDIYVFTGSYYLPNHKSIGKNQVWVPDYFYKLVYDSQTKKSWVHWLPNTEDVKMAPPISYEEFVKITGLRLLD